MGEVGFGEQALVTPSTDFVGCLLYCKCLGEADRLLAPRGSPTEMPVGLEDPGRREIENGKGHHLPLAAYFRRRQNLLSGSSIKVWKLTR
jgi:hypothetical protein